MNDEQRRRARFRAQPEGTGPFFRHPALHFARVDRPHRAQRALTGKKTAAVAATGQLLTDPSNPGLFMKLCRCDPASPEISAGIRMPSLLWIGLAAALAAAAYVA